jgi:transposase
MFFEGSRSERQLMEVAADRLSIRWYLGYDLNESLPDHSSLTRIREHYGLEVFRRFFERIVEMCFEAGLVRGEDLYFDACVGSERRPWEEGDHHPTSLEERHLIAAHLGLGPP